MGAFLLVMGGLVAPLSLRELRRAWGSHKAVADTPGIPARVAIAKAISAGEASAGLGVRAEVEGELWELRLNLSLPGVYFDQYGKMKDGKIWRGADGVPAAVEVPKYTGMDAPVYRKPGHVIASRRVEGGDGG